jgi:hypothetical protein
MAMEWRGKTMSFTRSKFVIIEPYHPQYKKCKTALDLSSAVEIIPNNVKCDIDYFDVAINLDETGMRAIESFIGRKSTLAQVATKVKSLPLMTVEEDWLQITEYPAIIRVDVTGKDELEEKSVLVQAIRDAGKLKKETVDFNLILFLNRTTNFSKCVGWCLI